MPDARQRKRVIVVGSGFAGYECARGLWKRLAAKAPDVEIVMVSPHNYMLYTPLLPEVAGGLVDPRYVAIPLANALPGVQYRMGRVESVDFDAQTITVTDCAPEIATMHWDPLVLTPGSVTRLFDIPGLAEHARGLKTVAEALYIREHFLHQLELADQETDPVRRQARRTVVVVGASYAGTELVSQLRALADTYTRQRDLDPSAVRFLLLDTADRVMPEVGPKLSGKALEVLRRRAIDIRLGTTLNHLAEDKVTLTDGTTVGTYTVAWVTGVTGAPMLEGLGLPLNRGRLEVEADLSVPGHPHVFAAGDAAAVPDLSRPGKITPPTAQHAVRQGRTVACNVAASLGVGRTRNYKHRDMGLVVDLGPGFAVANPLGVHMSGLPAKTVTRGYHLLAVPRGANRWAITSAYLTNLVSARPLSLLGLVSSDEAGFHSSEGIPREPERASAAGRSA